MLLVISSIEANTHINTDTYEVPGKAILRNHRCAGLHQCMSGLHNGKHKINQFYSS